MTLLDQLRAQLAKLHEERATHVATKDGVVAAVEARSATDLTAEETTQVTEARAAITKIDADITPLEARIAELEDEAARDAAAAESRAKLGTGPAPARTGNEPANYREGGSNSYFRDLAAANMRQSPDAMDRLRRNDREFEVETRALTTTDGSAGEFVPPLWMVDKFVDLARARRVIADKVAQEALPTGTDSINLPVLATGTAVAVQSSQNTAVQNTDATTSSVTAAVQTVAGQQVIPLQLLEQSPINMDAVLLRDLARDYATKLDVAVINGSVTNAKGLLNVTGINAVTYTDATPTVGELYPKVADGIQQIHTGRFEAPDVIFMHPRRWAWCMSALDANGRPLVVPSAQAPFNSLGLADSVNSQGYVGTMQGVPVFVDPSIPINLGAGTNEDRIIVLNSADVILFEGSPRAEAFRETKADQLSVLLRFYNYYALHAARYPKAISVVAGTGLITPTF